RLFGIAVFGHRDRQRQMCPRRWPRRTGGGSPLKMTLTDAHRLLGRSEESSCQRLELLAQHLTGTDFKAGKLLAGTSKHSDRPGIAARHHQLDTPGVVDHSGQPDIRFWPVTPVPAANRSCVAPSNTAFQKLLSLL